MRIQPNAISPASIQAPTNGSKTPDQGRDFGQTLMDALGEVDERQREARKLENKLVAGQQVEYHDLMIAMERASLAMQLTTQVRNKLLEAYQEVARMQV